MDHRTNLRTPAAASPGFAARAAALPTPRAGPGSPVWDAGGSSNVPEAQHAEPAKQPSVAANAVRPRHTITAPTAVPHAV